MTVNITESFVQQFTANIHDLLERKGTQLLPHVSTMPVIGDSAYVERLGEFGAMTEITGRHADTVIEEADHSRRKLSMRDFAKATMLDHQDSIKMLTDPLSRYSRKLANAMGKKVDDTIVEALLGTAKTGETGGTDVALPANQKIADGGTGLTVAKLLEVQEKFKTNNYFGKVIGVIHAALLTDLLNESEIQSFDFNSVKALVNGEVDTFMGIKFVIVQIPELVTGNKAVFFGEDALMFGMPDQMRVRITERSDKNYNPQVFIRQSFGAVRVEDELVVEVSVA